MLKLLTVIQVVDANNVVVQEFNTQEQAETFVAKKTKENAVVEVLKTLSLPEEATTPEALQELATALIDNADSVLTIFGAVKVRKPRKAKDAPVETETEAA